MNINRNVFLELETLNGFSQILGDSIDVSTNLVNTMFRRIAFSKPLRRVVTFSTIAFSLYQVDNIFYSKTITRSLRTLAVGAIITLDYKLNFTIGNAAKIHDLHSRTARRISDTCRENGGLYIKVN